MNILLIDLWNIFHISWHNGTNKEPRYPFHETMGRIRAIARQNDSTAIMTDGGKSFRAELDPRWKANRAEKETGLIPQLTEVERQLDAEGFHVFKVEGFEADDLIATAVHQLRKFSAISDPTDPDELFITINSGDRDLLSLLEPGVQMLKTTAPYQIVHAEDVRGLKNIGVDPTKIRDFLLLCDKHNGVKYFDGIGPVHAARLLNQFGDMKSILSALDNRVPDTDQFEVHPPSVRESLKRALTEAIGGRPLLDVAMQVVTLRTDAPIDIRKIFEKKAPKQTSSKNWEGEDEGKWQDDTTGERRRPDRTDAGMAGSYRSGGIQGDDSANDQSSVGAGRSAASGVAEFGGTERGAQRQVNHGRDASTDGERRVVRTDNEKATAGTSGVGPQPVGLHQGPPQVSPPPEVTDGPHASADEMGPTVRERPVAAREQEREPYVVAQPMGRDEGPRPSAGNGSEGKAPNQAPMIVVPRWELALEPPSIQDAWRLAQRAAECNFWPKHGGPPGCMMIIMAGRSRNLTAFDALNGMHIIEGKPCFGAWLLIGMVQRDKRCDYFELVESDEKHALWITKKKGSKREQKRLYTIDHAATARLIRPNSNWEKHPEDMLIKTAGAKLTRAAWADITSGAVAAEEMGYE